MANWICYNSGQIRCTTQALFPFSVMNRQLNQNVFPKNSSFSSLFITAHYYKKVVTEAKHLSWRHYRSLSYLLQKTPWYTHTHTSLHQWVLSFFMSWLEAPWDTLDTESGFGCLFWVFLKINSKILDFIVFRYTGNQNPKSTCQAICLVINNASSGCGINYWGFIV